MTDDDKRIAVRARIHGRVTGVGYRYWTVGQANALGLHGWVRNRSDATVELLAVGPKGRIDSLLAACQRGPSLANVTHIDVDAARMEDAGVGFRQLPTL